MSQGSYETVPGTGAENYNLVDPTGMSQDWMGNLMSGAQGAMNQWQAGPDDPNSFMNQYLGNFGQLQGAVTDATSPLTTQLQNQVQSLTQDAVSEVGNQFSGMNSLYSSGMGNVAGERAGQIAANAGVDLANAQLGLLSPLASNAMSQQGQYNNNMLGMAGSAFNPTYAAPQVAYSEGTSFGDVLGGASQGAAGGAAFGPWGAAIGGGLGALGSLF